MKITIQNLLILWTYSNKLTDGLCQQAKKFDAASALFRNQVED